MTTTRADVVAVMAATAQRQSTAVLCEGLLMLDRPHMTEAERLTRAVLMDVICERHPEADAAFDAWASDEASEPGGAVLAIVTAAVEAAERAAGLS
jgi:hypothetical protein